MPTLSKLILAAILRGLPFVIIILAASIHAVRRKCFTSGAISIGTLAISIQSIWSVFAPIWVRIHTPEEYGKIMLPIAIGNIAGWYLLSIAIAAMLMQRWKKPDNINLDHISGSSKTP